LLILRLAVAAFLIEDTIAPLTRLGSAGHTGATLAAAAAGVLLLAGLWTPVAGCLAALLELWIGFARPDGPWASLMAAAIAFGLAFVGPGAWSIDALAYGRKRISIRDR
jgi:putative oxidoreductase